MRRKAGQSYIFIILVSEPSCLWKRYSSHQEICREVNTNIIPNKQFSQSFRRVQIALYFSVTTIGYRILMNKCTNPSKSNFLLTVNGYFIFAFRAPFS